MRFEEIGKGRSRVVMTNRVCGAAISLLGAAPLVWVGFAVALGVLAPHHWVVLVCGAGVSMFGLAVLGQRRVMTFSPSGLRFEGRWLWRRQVLEYPKRMVRRFRLTRHVRDSVVSPFGFEARAVQYLVHVEFLGSGEPYQIFQSHREERAHRVAHSAAANIAVALRDEIGNDLVDIDVDAMVEIRDDEVSLAHPPPAIAIDMTPGVNALQTRGRIAPGRRAAAVLEWLLFGGVTVGLGILLVVPESSWGMALLGVAILIAGFPCARVTGAALTRERLERLDDSLLIERRVLGCRVLRLRLPRDGVLLLRLQTRDATIHGLAVGTRTHVCRVGVSLRRDDLIWLRGWIQSHVSATVSGLQSTRRSVESSSNPARPLAGAWSHESE
jgi:hypothetical protein